VIFRSSGGAIPAACMPWPKGPVENALPGFFARPEVRDCDLPAGLAAGMKQHAGGPRHGQQPSVQASGSCRIWSFSA